MSCYVDESIEGVRGRSKNSHLIADSTKELNAMAQKIGVARDEIDLPGTATEHLDITLTQRQRAVRLGATPITLAELGVKVREKRARQ